MFGMHDPDLEATRETGASRTVSAEDAVLQLAIAYKGSRALHVATRLGIPDLLVGEPKSAEDLAPLVKTPVETLQRLLRALAAYDVVNETSDGRFTIGGSGPVSGPAVRMPFATWC